ncbi:UbiX family flavin prenyltransferase [Brackiella oedipodis]|uniref:UbiX family flavin prenyltransferase n=1 Tax=Brackiella oedipodis TaxID=124225 RepID=UPI00048CEEFE|nr:UbiX family flavin prenyltransferase [Brackiella oedipodis]
MTLARANLPKKRLVIAVTGATGAIYAVRMLQMLQNKPEVETHLVVSSSGVLNLQYELGMGRHELYKLADFTYNFKDVGAKLASGAFATAGMVIVPCSMHTLASTAIGLSDNLITRAADVHLKEKRRLVLVVRETPFNLAHLRNMTSVTEMGGIIYPPLPAFYQHPKDMAEMIDHTVGRILALFDIQTDMPEWQGA